MSIRIKKPNILRDVRSRYREPFFDKKDYYQKIKNENNQVLKKIKNIFVVLITIAIFFSISNDKFMILAPTAFSQASEAERRELELELKKIEEEIDQYEDNISNLQSQKKTLSQSINLINAEIKKLELQIRATNIQLGTIDGNIGKLKVNITTAESDIDRLKMLLANSLRKINDEEARGILEMVLGDEDVSDVFDNLKGLAIIQDEVRANLVELIDLKTNLIVKKEDLTIERGDVLSLKNIKERQANQLDAKKKEKDYLMSITEGQESAFQKLLSKSKKTAAQIRSRIFEFLGGGELSFGEAYELAKFAEQQTGVRAAMILAVLDKESNLGKNVGSCDWETAMHPKRDRPVFLNIMAELGMEPSSVSVSCPILSDGAYGGAMGPAQFIPSTWNVYKNKISSFTGNNPPSPWRNVDAFMATALFLKDLGADAQTYYAERKAAAKYYAGSRWQRYIYSYGQWVVSKANKFQDDIDSLEGI